MMLKIIHTIIAATFISIYGYLLYIVPETWWYYGLILISALITQRIYYKEQVAERELIRLMDLKY